MGKKFARKMMIFVIAAAMVLSSGIGVFAASSSEVGAVSNLNSTEKYSNKSVVIQWGAVSDASAYVIYKNGREVARVSGTSYTLTGLKDGEQYTLSIAAVAKDGKTVGQQVTIQNNTLTKRWMKPIKVKKAKKGKKKATFKWKKVKGATGYQIRYSKDGKTWKTKYVKGGKKTKTTIKKLSKGKWYYRIRAVKNGYLGVQSGTKTVNVK